MLLEVLRELEGFELDASLARSETTAAREVYQLAEALWVWRMASALMGIGKRNKQLNAAALKVAKGIGPIRPGDTCDPMDVAKHLTSDWLKGKLGVA